MKSIISILCTIMVFVCMHSNASCQSIGDFRTHQTGNWNSTSTWERWDGSTWVTPAPNTPTSSDGVITILNGHTVTVTADVSVDQVTVNSGGQITVNGGITLTVVDGAGTDLTVDGTLNGTGTLQTQGTVTLVQGGTFSAPLRIVSGTTTTNSDMTVEKIVVDNGATLTIGTPCVGSSCGYTLTATDDVTIGGILTNASGGGNCVFNFTGATFTNNGTVGGIKFTFTGTTFNNNGSLTCNTTFNKSGAQSIVGTGTWTGNMTISNSSSTSLSNAVTFGGSSLTINSGTTLSLGSNNLVFSGSSFNSSGTISGTGEVRMQGTVSFGQGGTFSTLLRIVSGTTTTNVSMTVGAIVVDNGATLTIGTPCGGSSCGYTLTATDDVTIGGILTSASGGGSCEFIFTGTTFTNNGTMGVYKFTFNKSGAQSIVGTGTWTGKVTISNSSNTSLSNDVSFSSGTVNVNTGTTLSLGSNNLVFSGSSFNSSGTISGSGAVKMQGTISFGQGGTFSALLRIVSGTTTTDGDMTVGAIVVDNGATLTIGSPPCSPCGYTLTATNDVTIDGILTNAGSNCVFFFTGTIFTNNGTMGVKFTFNKSGAQSLSGTGNFSSSYTATINSGSTVTLGSNHQMGLVTISSGGAMDISSRTLSLSGSGTPLTNNGTFTTTGSTIVYNGSSAQTVATTNVSYNNLTINNSAGVTLSAAKSVPGMLTLTNGTFSGAANLTLGNGASITRATGSLSGTPTFTTSVNVQYTGSSGVTTGTEIPTSSTVLNNLTINNSGGVTLNASATVNGTCTLTSGTFAVGTNTLALNSTVTATSGSLTSSATGTVNYNQGTNGQNVLAANYGNLTFSNYTKTLPSSGTIGIAETFTVGATGGHTITGSTIEYNGTSAQSLPANFSTYNNLSLNNTAGTSGFSGLTVNGTLEVKAGTFTSASTYKDVQIDNGATLACSGSSTINVSGVWTNNGTFTVSTGTVVLNGSSAQTIGGSNATTFNNLEINNSNDVTLNQSATVNGTLTFTNGKITLGSNTLTIGSSGSISGATSSKYIVTDGSGTLTRNGVGATDVSFPVGTSSSSYNPAIINNSGTSDNFSVKVKVGFDNAPNNSQYVDRQWTITEAVAGGSNAMIKLQWNTANENTGFIRTDPIYIGRWTGTAWVQTLATYTDVGGGVYTAHASGFDTFSPFGIGNNGALPVELTSFSASLKSNKVHLQWRTATEVNNYGFEVERNVNSLNSDWVKIGFVDGRGTVNTQQSYSFIDQLDAFDMISKTIYYRLKQIDRDGKYEYSSVVNVSPSSEPTTIRLYQNYPNPFSKSSQGNSSTNITFSLPRAEKISLVVYDVLGNVITRLVDGVTLDAGNHIYTFFGNGLPNGMYVYELRTESSVLKNHLVLEK